jgi:hypothetical protein
MKFIKKNHQKFQNRINPNLYFFNFTLKNERDRHLIKSLHIFIPNNKQKSNNNLKYHKLWESLKKFWSS